jgi:hypothetical protein
MNVPEAPRLTARNALAWLVFGLIALAVAVAFGALTVAQAGHAVVVTLGVLWQFTKALGAVIAAAYHELRGTR